MRINEVIVESKQLEEGWKQKLAAVALSAGAALGGYSGSADAQSFANFPWSVVDSQFRNETTEKFLKNVTVEDVKKLAFLIGVIEPYYERNDLNRSDEKDYRLAKSLLRQSAEKLMSETQQDSLRKIQKQGFDKTMQGVKDKGWGIKIPGVLELDDLISSVSNKSSTGTNKTQSQLSDDEIDVLKKHLDRMQDKLAKLKTYNLNLQHYRDYADKSLDIELEFQQYFLDEYKNISNPLKKKKYSDLLTVYNSRVDELASYVKNSNTASAAQQISNSTKYFSEAPTTDTPERLAFALGVVSGNWEFLSANDRTIAKRVYEQWKKTASPAIIKKFEQGSEEGRQSWSTQEQVNEYTKAVAAYYAKQAVTDTAQEPQSTSRELQQPLPTDANSMRDAQYTNHKTGDVYKGTTRGDDHTAFHGLGSMTYKSTGDTLTTTWENRKPKEGAKATYKLKNGTTYSGFIKDGNFFNDQPKIQDQSAQQPTSNMSNEEARKAAAKKAAADKALKDAFRADALAQSSRQNSSTENYATKIRNCIQAGVSYSASSNQPNISTMFRVSLNPDGLISDINLVKSSGNSKFDNAVKVGIQSCSKFPKLENNNFPKFIDINYNLF